MNITSMLDEDYPGASVCQMTDFSRKGGETAVKFLDPTGQGAANGRSGDHSWNDVVPGVVYERLAERYARNGDPERAGRFRRAAMLTLQGEDRWRRQDCPDPATNCQYSVTKNQFPSSARVPLRGLQRRHQLQRQHGVPPGRVVPDPQDDITERPTWSEIGGYAFVDRQRARGRVRERGRHARAGGDARPDGAGRVRPVVDGARRGALQPAGLGLAARAVGRHPRRLDEGRAHVRAHGLRSSWVRLASIPVEYTASFSQSFQHPLLVRFRLTYRPTGSAAAGSPTLTQDFVVTPDGVYVTLTSSTTARFGMTFPLLVNDGRNALTTSTSGGIASVRYTAGHRPAELHHDRLGAARSRRTARRCAAATATCNRSATRARPTACSSTRARPRTRRRRACAARSS
jgi:hypothetical protein